MGLSYNTAAAYGILLMTLEYFPKEKRNYMVTSLFVGNLPFAYDSAKLGELFAVAGTVISAKIISDKYSGRSRGFGFVEMSSEDEMKKAIELLNGKDVEGRPLVVNESRPREDRAQQ